VGGESFQISPCPVLAWALGVRGGELIGHSFAGSNGVGLRKTKKKEPGPRAASPPPGHIIRVQTVRARPPTPRRSSRAMSGQTINESTLLSRFGPPEWPSHPQGAGRNVLYIVHRAVGLRRFLGCLCPRAVARRRT